MTPRAGWVILPAGQNWGIGAPLPLRQMAERIQARAIARCGALLRSIAPARGGDRGNSATGGRSPVGTRTSAARDAGMSRDQKRTALRVANVPTDQFDRLVESAIRPGDRVRVSVDFLARLAAAPAVVLEVVNITERADGVKVLAFAPSAWPTAPALPDPPTDSA